MTAKTLLKMILGVLLLSGIFFFALQFWEKNRARQAQIEATQTEPEKSIKEVSVKPGAMGATLEIKEITGSTYAISSDEKGFTINFPDLKVDLAQKSLPLPHPLIESVETAETGAAGQPGAKVKVILATKAKYKTRQQEGTLFVDIEKEPEVVATKPPTMAKKKAIRKNKSVSRKKSPRPVAKKSKPKSTPKKTTSPAANAQEDEFLAQLGIVDGPVDSVPVVEPPSTGGTADSGSTGQEGSFGSNDLFDSGAAPLPFDAGMEGGSDVAMNAPIQKNFDPSQVMSNLPAVTDLQVVNEGGITKVRITRGAKTKYKVFPKRNPNRIVIDFQNVTNQLPAEMGGFSGTRVDKIRNTQFVSADGTITRIELFINNMPEYDRTAIVNTGNFFELPIL